MTDEENKVSDSYPFGVEPPGVAEPVEQPEGTYVPRTMEERVAELPQLPPITLPARSPHPGKPRKRTWVDNDGDIWQESKTSTNLVESIQDGQVVRRDFRDVEEQYGPLIELDAINTTTAMEATIDGIHSTFVNFLRHGAKHDANEQVRERLTTIADEVERWAR